MTESVPVILAGEPSPVPARPRALPDREYWLTRERWFGALVDHIGVWVTRPVRMRCEDGDVLWHAALEDVDVRDTYLMELLVEDVRAEIGVVPATDLECIHVGGK